MLYSAVFKAKARAVLQNHWQTALLIALIVNLPSLLVQGIAAFTNSDLTIRLENLVLEASRNSAAMNSLPDAARDLLSESGIQTMALLGVLAWLAATIFALGMNHWTLDRIRGAEEPVSTVFSRLPVFFKAVGLRLFITLKVLLSTLPGIAVVILAMVILFRADVTSQEALLSAANTSLMLIYAGMILMLVLGVMEYLRYALADFILADEPEERVLSCARRSRELMTGKRTRLLALLLSFIIWSFLISVVSAFISGIAGDVVSLMIQMLGNLFLSVYMLTSEGVFYEMLRSAPVQVPQDGLQEPFAE